MGKRDFRQAHHDVQPTYPTHRSGLGRREFLAGAFLIAGGGALLSACGGRAIEDEPKPNPQPNPNPPEHYAGGAPMPPAPADGGPPEPDVQPPDTTHDRGEPDSEPEHWAGGMPGPPARVDAGAADDSGDCPLP
ncbi:MAG: hypothetical protein KC503_07010 [Myxococcales bacterium]|nr:hypothetical protein [Myxococcales bacterium]